MKRFTAIILLLASATASLAADTVATSAATLELTSLNCEIFPQLFTPNWQGQRSKGGLTHDTDGSFAFTLDANGLETLKGKAFFSQADKGAIDAVYIFTPIRDVPLNALYVGLTLPTDLWAGGTWSNGEQNGTIPRDQKDLTVCSQTSRSLTLLSREGQKHLTFTFPVPTAAMIQDDRRWGPSFSVRIGYIGGTKTFKAGEPYTIRFTLATHEPQRLVLDEPVTIHAGPEWIILKQEPEILANSALDFSKLGFSDTPAGKYGRVVAKGAHFEFEQKPGLPQRFYGVNLCFTANFLEPADASRLAARLARTGYNALRLHHYDDGLVEGSADGTTLNTANLARLDALMAACISNGIYVTTDLYVSRSIPWRSVGIDRDGKIEMNEYKVLVPVHEGAMENFKTFAGQLLNHVNPYTGHRYADEPALAWLAMINEGNFGNYLSEMKNIPEWQQAWSKWLADRQIKEPKVYADIPATNPDSIYNGNRHTTAYLLFLKETEDRLITRLKTFLHDQIKCRALVTDRNAWTNHASDQVPRSELFDYVDDHFYVDHPQFIERPWSLPSKCANENPVKNEAMGAQHVVFTRLLDKPFTITEYNYSGPGRFRGVGGIVTGAMGALQDWAGIWRFTYSHSRNGLLQPEGYAMGYFDMASDPLSLAAERATLCLFVRGDLAPLKRTYAMVLPKSDVLQMREALPQNNTSWPWLGWYARLGTQVADRPPAEATWSGRFPEVYKTSSADIRTLIAPDASKPFPPAGDGAVKLDQESGSFVLVTPRTCGGFAENGIVDAGDLIFDIGDTAATVWVSSLDSTPIKKSPRLLLTHLTDVQNSGIRYAQRSRKTLLAWGGLPHLARNGKADIRLAVEAAKNYKVYALSTGGRRVGEIPVHVVKGRLAFTVSVNGQPDSATLLYEIVKE